MVTDTRRCFYWQTVKGSRCIEIGIYKGVIQGGPVVFIGTVGATRPVQQVNGNLVRQQPVHKLSVKGAIGATTNNLEVMRRGRVLSASFHGLKFAGKRAGGWWWINCAMNRGGGEAEFTGDVRRKESLFSLDIGLSEYTRS